MNVKPTIEPVYKIDKPSDNYTPNEVYDTGVGYVKRQLKKMKPNDICPEHGKKFKKKCSDKMKLRLLDSPMKLQMEFQDAIRVKVLHTDRWIH